jgi:hypothetical protein
MGLSWINPLYLAGLSLLALPVLIHLVQRQQANGIKFPSLMFLRQIPWREKRRLEIRHWLLLLLRCLLLLLVVFAFARPFLSGESAPVMLDLERSDSVIVIDRSYSMRISDSWQQAQQIALQLVDEKQTQDRIGVVAFDDEAEVVSDLTENAANLRTVIERQAPGLRTTRIRAALEQAARLLAGSNAQHKRILLVSDFQAAGIARGDLPLISQDTEVIAHAVKLADSANTSISSVSVMPSTDGANDEFTLAVELTNHSAKPMAQRVGLALDGRVLEQRELNLPPGAVVTQTFSGLSPGASLVRGVVSLADDGLALDNRAYFVYSNQQKLPLLIIEGPRPRANQSIYLESALRLARDPAFRVERRSWNQLEVTELSSWAVIVIDDTTIPGGDMGTALRDFVAAGGGLLVPLGTAQQDSWLSSGDGFLPGKPQRPVDARSGTAFGIRALDIDHPLNANRDSGTASNLSTASIFSYRMLQPNAGDRVLAYYDDDGVALVERQLEQGKTLVLTTTLDPHWNDFALQPAFLPFLHQALRYLAGYDAYQREFEVGDIAYVMRYARAQAGSDAIVAGATAAPLIVETPSADIVRLERQQALLPIDEPGFYQVHRATPAEVEVVLAANIDSAEANPRTLDVARFVEEIKASARPAPPVEILTRRQAADYEQQQQLWHLVLSAALVLLLLEALVANRVALNRSVRPGVKI